MPLDIQNEMTKFLLSAGDFTGQIVGVYNEAKVLRTVVYTLRIRVYNMYCMTHCHTVYLLVSLYSYSYICSIY